MTTRAAAIMTAALLVFAIDAAAQAPARPRSPEAATALLAEAARSPLVTLREIGTSAGGRPITAVRLAHAEATPMWRVLLIGSQHGNEPAGREALLELVRMVAADGDLLPVDTEVWAIPTANPDGTAADTRRNAAGADLNRDWLTLEQPETRAIHALARELPPDVAVDLHEFDRTSSDWRDAGWDEWPLVTLDTANHPLLPDAVYDVGLAWIAAAGRRLDAAGIPFRRYLVGGVPPDEELRPSTLDPDDARNALALVGSLAFIVESGVKRADPDPNADLPRRVAAQLELIDLFIRDRGLREASLAAVEAARRAPCPSWIPVNVLWGNVGLKTDEVEAIDRATNQAVAIPTANVMHDRIVKRAVEAPAAYVVLPSAADTLAALLDRHGLSFERLEAPRAVTAERCRLERVEESSDEVYQRYGGRQIVSCAPRGVFTLPAGSLVVPIAGRCESPDAARAAAVLEPQQLYGLYQFATYRATVAADGAIPVLRVMAGK